MKLLAALTTYRSGCFCYFAGVDPDSDEEADEADPGLGDAGDAEEENGNKVRQMVASSSPGPLLAQT
jgi:hypothetical protein